MTVAEIRVTGVRAETVFCNIIPAGIIGAKINFDYADAMWDGLKKTVVLKGCCTKDIINAGNTVEIPAEVVAKPGVRVTVGVYGVDSENNIAIPTLWADLSYRDGIRIIPEVITVTLAFKEGELGWWYNDLYQSNKDDNVYTPAVRPDDWTLVISAKNEE